MLEPIRRMLEEAVKKLKVQADQINLKINQRRTRTETEIEIADIRAKTGMRPWADYQILVGDFLRARIALKLRIVPLRKMSYQPPI